MDKFNNSKNNGGKKKEKKMTIEYFGTQLNRRGKKHNESQLNRSELNIVH